MSVFSKKSPAELDADDKRYLFGAPGRNYLFKTGVCLLSAGATYFAGKTFFGDEHGVESGIFGLIAGMLIITQFNEIHVDPAKTVGGTGKAPPSIPRETADAARQAAQGGKDHVVTAGGDGQHGAAPNPALKRLFAQERTPG